MRIHLTPVRMIKKIREKHWWWCRVKATLKHRWLECILVSSVWKTVWRSLKNKKRLKTLIWSSNPTCWYIFEGNKIGIFKKYLYSHVYGNIIDIAKRRKQPKNPSTDEWIKKILHIKCDTHLCGGDDGHQGGMDDTFISDTI